MMNAREYLQSIADAGKRIELKTKQIQHLHDSLTSLSAPMDKEQVSHSRNVSIMSDTIARIVDMERELDGQTERLFLVRQEAMRFFDLLKPRNGEILTARYLNGKKVSELMKEYAYGRTRIFTMTCEAIQELQEVFNRVGSPESRYSYVPKENESEHE